MVRSHQKYSLESLQQAIKACSDGLMSSVEAAKSYGVPESTIRNHKRQPSMSIGSGRPFLLNKTEEEYLVQLLLDLEQMSVRLTKDKVLKVVQEFVGSLKQNQRKSISSQCINFYAVISFTF
jgi:transposase